nr:MAG: hypothetical protein DIU78_11870 [Pseudomonadota bacterium]
MHTDAHRERRTEQRELRAPRCLRRAAHDERFLEPLSAPFGSACPPPCSLARLRSPFRDPLLAEPACELRGGDAPRPAASARPSERDTSRCPRKLPTSQSSISTPPDAVPRTR